jgi:DnaJ-class molecular chaperone
MEYGQEVLAKSGKMQGRRHRTKRFTDSVPCAYCRGSGVNPTFGAGSRCPVCGGAGKIKVAPPVVTCLKCRGMGRERGNLTCLACRGAGAVSVRKDAATCPKCKGTGKDGVFYCTTCKGQGVA